MKVQPPNWGDPRQLLMTFHLIFPHCKMGMTTNLAPSHKAFINYNENTLTKSFEFVVKIFWEYLSEYRIWGLMIKEWSLTNDIFQILASFIQISHFLGQLSWFLGLFLIVSFSFNNDFWCYFFPEKSYYWYLKCPVNFNLPSSKIFQWWLD